MINNIDITNQSEDYPTIDLEIVLLANDFDRCVDAINENLYKRYINKIYKNIIIQELSIYHDGQIITSLVDMYNNLTVSCKIVRYMQLKIGDILEGYIDLSEDKPLFRSQNVKMNIDEVSRQSDNIMTSYGSKLSQGDKCTAKIQLLNLCEGSHFFQGNVKLLNPDSTSEINKTPSLEEIVEEHPEQQEE